MKLQTEIAKIAPALLAAQKAIGAAKKGSTNPFFRSKYADLGSVMEACKEALNDQGILVIQPVGFDEMGDYVETILLHESGEMISEKTRVKYAKEKDPQSQGSGITYARRYALQSMLFIPAEDDDGEKAMARPKKIAPKRGENLYCNIHKQPMEKRISSKTGRAYIAHYLPDKTVCFGS